MRGRSGKMADAEPNADVSGVQGAEGIRPWYDIPDPEILNLFEFAFGSKEIHPGNFGKLGERATEFIFAGNIGFVFVGFGFQWIAVRIKRPVLFLLQFARHGIVLRKVG